MKVILLPYRASMLIIGFAMLVAGLNAGDDILVECGITKEKDATLHKCLEDSLEQLREQLKNIENQAGGKNYTVIKQLFEKSMKCFPEEKTEEKSCYRKTMKKKFLQIKRSQHIDVSYGADEMYNNYRRDIKILLKSCIMDRITSTHFCACLDGFNPEAQRIIRSAKNNERQAFERMIVLLSNAQHCYKDFNHQQGKCLLDQKKILKKNITDQMKKRGKVMVEKLTKCGVSAETIETLTACTHPKADAYIKLSFQIFQKPEHARHLWNLLEALRTCITESTEIMKCLMPRSDDRPERQERGPAVRLK